MCQYRYHLYLNCGHHCIECMRPCARRYWSAGLNGILSLCAPYIIMPSKEWKGPPEEEPPRPVDFLAFTGHCSKCHIAKPKLPQEPSQRVPERDTRLHYAPGQFDPYAMAPSFGYIDLKATLPCLLGIVKEIEAQGDDPGEQLVFFDQGHFKSWAGLRKAHPYKVEGKLSQRKSAIETLTVKEVQQRLQCTGGLTRGDRATIVERLKMNTSPTDLDIRAVYDDHFKVRGMPFEALKLHVEHFWFRHSKPQEPPQQQEEQANSGDINLQPALPVANREIDVSSAQSEGQMLPTDQFDLLSVYMSTDKGQNIFQPSQPVQTGPYEQSLSDEGTPPYVHVAHKQNSYYFQGDQHPHWSEQSQSTIAPQSSLDEGQVDAVEVGNDWTDRYFKRNIAPCTSQSSPPRSHKKSQAVFLAMPIAHSQSGLFNERVQNDIGTQSSLRGGFVGGHMSSPYAAQSQGMREIDDDYSTIQEMSQLTSERQRNAQVLEYSPREDLTPGEQSSPGPFSVLQSSPSAVKSRNSDRTGIRGIKRPFEKTKEELEWLTGAGGNAYHHRRLPRDMSPPALQNEADNFDVGQPVVDNMSARPTTTFPTSVVASGSGVAARFFSPVRPQPTAPHSSPMETRPHQKRPSKSTRNKHSARTRPWDRIKPDYIDKVAHLNPLQKQRVKAELEQHWATLRTAQSGSEEQTQARTAIEGVKQRLINLIMSKTRETQIMIAENEHAPDPAFSSPDHLSANAVDPAPQQQFFSAPPQTISAWYQQMNPGSHQLMPQAPQQNLSVWSQHVNSDFQQIIPQSLQQTQMPPSHQQHTLPDPSQLDLALQNFNAMVSRF